MTSFPYKKKKESASEDYKFFSKKKWQGIFPGSVATEYSSSVYTKEQEVLSEVKFWISTSLQAPRKNTYYTSASSNRSNKKM